MSDDDRDIDVESDEGEDSDTRQPTVQRQTTGNQYYSQAEKRAHHNALERKRRDHIKDSFSSLRDTVPALNGEKVASRAQILKKAAEYIMLMRRKNSSHQRDIDDLKRQNSLLEAQSKIYFLKEGIWRHFISILITVNQLEKAKATGSFSIDSGDRSSYNDSESDTSEGEMPVQRKRTKKVKSSHH
ncbi:protein max isoform X1 [Coccinella septempunctata]|uniref:protein max isoform X1 n=1 Tax=Coccinella septempunctata TaxID=41139 RepID=UPI001D0811EC|nr:protein max isoform X1 [Coccinella septempunctata]